MASDESREQAFGSVLLPLVTQTREQYRLRSARFDVTRTGNNVATLDSEADPSAVALEAQLPQGSYQILLQSGWVVERLGDGGAGTVVTAGLLTPNPQSFEVQDSRVTELTYSFATSDGVVTFGRGAVSVSVDVGEASSAPTTGCNPLDRASCPSGQTCLLSGDSDLTFCAQAGTIEVGQPCTSNQCVPGAQCLALDPSQPEARRCEQFCSPASSFCGCQGIAGNPNVGLCTQPFTGTGFAHNYIDFTDQDRQVACNEWNQFRTDLQSAPPSTNFNRVTLSGSLGGGFECTDSAIATQICRAMRDGSYLRVNCQGHTWATNTCYSPEVTVDGSTCSCTNSVRPCNWDFGGVGPNSCNVIPQTLVVTCDKAPVCGNGIVEAGEVCDHNGAGADVPTPPDGQQCKGDCKGFEPKPTMVPNSAECRACTENNCIDLLQACADAADNLSQSPPGSCETVLDCMHAGFDDRPGCATEANASCYCGNNGPGGTVDLGACLGGTSNGECKEVIRANSGCIGSPNEPVCILTRQNDTEWGYGDANQVVNCQRNNCSTECRLTP